MKTYYFLLDLLRFFAAFWVMNFHYFLGLSGALSWYRYGNLGVQLFFIISGFVIVQSLQGKTLKEFAIGRFIRLFPLFWILCTATYILTLLVPHANPVSFTEYLISMTMLGDKFGSVLGYMRLVDAAYWTLAVELIFYAVTGIFVFLFSYKNLRYFLSVWLIVSMLSYLFKLDQNFFIKLLLVRHTAYFVFGGTLALIAIKQAGTVFQKYFDYTLLAVTALYAIYIHPRALPPYFVPNALDPTIITILHIVFFLGIIAIVYFSKLIQKRKTTAIIAMIGGLTYPLYLLHETIGNTIIKYVTDTYTIPWNHFAIVFEVIIIGVAYFVYKQDKKMRSWLRRKLQTTE
jgi:peptidoglycan/LPS O-acetylase OafA/YrhL